MSPGIPGTPWIRLRDCLCTFTTIFFLISLHIMLYYTEVSSFTLCPGEPGGPVLPGRPGKPGMPSVPGRPWWMQSGNDTERKKIKNEISTMLYNIHKYTETVWYSSNITTEHLQCTYYFEIKYRTMWIHAFTLIHITKINKETSVTMPILLARPVTFHLLFKRVALIWQVLSCVAFSKR